jgi:MSHA biogenesis protein MshQ
MKFFIAYADSCLKKTGNFIRLFRLTFLWVVIGFCVANSSYAATYNLTSGQYPPCNTSWSVSGTTYTCNGNGRVTLASGDVLTSNTTITISANDGFVLSNNVIGSVTNNINLISSYGAIQSGNTNTIYGSITSGSGNITLINTSVTGTITTGGNINLTGGSVGGKVTSSSNTITTNGTNLYGGAQARSGMSFTGGTLAGSFVMTSNNPVTFSGVTMTSGSISGASTVTIQNGSVLGSSSSSISISSTSGAITVNNSTVYGNLTAPNYSTVNVTNNGAVYGSCLPNSTPANACNFTPPVCTTGLIGGLLGNYYNNTNLSGNPAGTRLDTNVNFDWGAGPPGVANVNSNQFGVVWTGKLRAPTTGNYRFQTVSDDGVRLWVNNQLIINNWNDHSATTNTSATITLEAGYAYDVRLEYYENGGQAVIRLLWNPPGTATFSTLGTAGDPNQSTANYCEVPVASCDNGFVGAALGQYFNNNNLSGTATATRQDLTIDFDWGTGAPGVTGVNADNFSVRWNATLKVNTTGSYQFQTLSDDGVRLWVNNQLIINNWTDHPVTTDTSTSINLVAGQTYPVRLEFYERGGYAVMSLRWRRPGDSTFLPISGCPSQVSYYGIDHSGPGLTCTAEPITISAYDANGALVAPNAGTQVTLSTSPATGSWVESTHTFLGTENTFVAYLRQPTPATLNINVTDGTYSESQTLDPSITFLDTGLKFYNSTGSNAAIVNQRAGVTATTPVLRAVRTDSDTGACEARVTGTHTVNLGYECVNPTTCIAGQTFTLQGTGIAANNLNGSANRTPVSLTFNASGEAPIPFTYSDVGRVRLHASLPLTASGNNPAITLAGTSGEFVVRPERLAVTAVQRSNGSNNPGGTTAAGTAAGFVAAGEAFKVVVQAQNANQQPTPNFGREIQSENNILLKEFALVHPVGATLTALSNGTGGNFAATTAGSFENSNLRWNQVGSLTLRPELADNDYLGAGAPDYIVSNTVGRFYPHRFEMVSQSLNNSCDTFSYMSQQQLPLNYEIKALSETGAVLSNYGATYGTLPSLTYVAENANAGNGASLSSRVSETSAKIWSEGVLTVGTNATFNRAAAPDGPYPDLNIGLILTDTFDARELANKDMNAGAVGVCTGASCNARQLNATPLNLRFGRLRLDDAFGPGTADLPVNFITEYWFGNRFIQNLDDSCTQVLRSAITYPAGSILTASNLTVGLTGGSTTGTYDSMSATDIIFSDGDAGHSFSAPGANATGTFPVNVDLTSYPWLRFDWNGDGVYTDASLPTAEFGFGQYRGHDRIIYWRERFD